MGLSEQAFSWHHFVHELSVGYCAGKLSVESGGERCYFGICAVESILLHDALEVLSVQVTLSISVNRSESIMNAESWTSRQLFLSNLNLLVDPKVKFYALIEKVPSLLCEVIVLWNTLVMNISGMPILQLMLIVGVSWSESLAEIREEQL